LCHINRTNTHKTFCTAAESEGHVWWCCENHHQTWLLPRSISWHPSMLRMQQSNRMFSMQWRTGLCNNIAFSWSNDDTVVLRSTKIIFTRWPAIKLQFLHTTIKQPIVVDSFFFKLFLILDIANEKIARFIFIETDGNIFFRSVENWISNPHGQ